MSSSFELGEVDLFTAGTVGPPGQRVFYLQVRADGRVFSLRLEKGQVAALCRYLEEMLADLLAESGPAPTPDMDLVEPVVAEWVVGTMGVSYEEDNDRFVLIAEELVPGDIDEDEDDDDDDDEEEGIGGGIGEGIGEGISAEGPDRARARIVTTRQQAAAFARHGAEIVAAGRPPCPLCGAPLDPEGHVCVRLNGHRNLAN